VVAELAKADLPPFGIDPATVLRDAHVGTAAAEVKVCACCKKLQHAELKVVAEVKVYLKKHSVDMRGEFRKFSSIC